MKYLNVWGVLLSIFFAAGCAGIQPSPPVTSGEKLMMDFSCRSQRHGLVITTSRDTAENSGVKKARIFYKFPDYHPVSITAGGDSNSSTLKNLVPLPHELVRLLSQAVVGKSKNRSHEIRVETDVRQGLKDQFRYRVFERNRTIPRYRELSKEAFVYAHNREPELGEVFYEQDKPYLMVSALDDKTVTLKTLGDTLSFEVPWGTVTVLGGDDETVRNRLDSEVGRLVKINGVVGRVTKITDDHVVVDRGHPFGGEALICDVTVSDPEPMPESDAASDDLPEKHSKTKRSEK